MCLDCGCGKPNDTHGDERHITMQQLQDAAKASEVSPQEAAQNIMNAVKMDGGQQMQGMQGEQMQM
jgi:hypothetical protein